MKAAVASLALLALLVPQQVLAKSAAREDESWWQRIEFALKEAAAPYRIVPPTPIEVRWQPREIWSGELKGELVDMIGADLHGNGRSDLVVLTSEKLLVLSMQRGLFDVRMQAELPARSAPIRSRDATGSLSLVRASDAPLSIRARSSEQAVGGIYQLADNTISKVGEFRGFPVCESGTILASPGRNYFLSSRMSWDTSDQANLAEAAFAGREFSEALYSLRCSTGLVDPQGRAAHYLSAVSTDGELRVYCSGNAEHCLSQEPIVVEVGDAHLVADVNHDGLPEVVHATRSAPGTKDRVVVMQAGPQGPATQYAKDFEGGVIAIATGDFAGHGASEIIVAVRQGQSKRVTLWLLN